MMPPNPSKVLSEEKGLKEHAEGFPPKEADLSPHRQSQLTDFILHLIQAFLRTGYYTPEHPESKRAKEGLYQQLRRCLEDKSELTFLVREDQEQKEIFIDGLHPEPQKLSRMMARGMAELYIPKLAEYLERKTLISLTLKSRMEQGEFTRFIDLMSEPSTVDIRRKEDKERFVQAVYCYNIFNISYLFDEEVLAPKREIPWRARLMLSRIRKDLKMIPYFQKMSEQELQQSRKKLIQDGIRPIHHFDLLSAILQNSDLAATPQTPEEIIEDGIISSIPTRYFLGTANFFLRQHLTLKQRQSKDASEVKSDRLLKKICCWLHEMRTIEAENLLEEIFRHKLISLEELPERVQYKILLERETDQFVQNPDQFFQQLDHAQEKEDFLARASLFAQMVPELIRRDRYPEVLRILESLERHSLQGSIGGPSASQILEEIFHGSTPLLLKEKFLTTKKEFRLAIVPIFLFFRGEAIPHLLSILKASEDQWVRKSAGEVLIQIGEVAIAPLLQELEEPQISIEATCDMLHVLGEIKSPQWRAPLVKILKSYTSHRQPKIREQAVHTLCQIGGTEGEDYFISSLHDPNLEVRKRAIWCLGMIKSLRGAKKMMDTLKEIFNSPTEQTDQLETQIYHAFGTMGNLAVEDKTLEQTLIEVLEERGIKRWGGLFQKNLLPDSALRAICDALGKIGTERSIKSLSKLGKSYGDSWVSRVEEALKRIEKRAGSSEH